MCSFLKQISVSANIEVQSTFSGKKGDRQRSEIKVSNRIEDIIIYNWWLADLVLDDYINPVPLQQ